jgi:hypothetical protein
VDKTAAAIFGVIGIVSIVTWFVWASSNETMHLALEALAILEAAVLELPHS